MLVALNDDGDDGYGGNDDDGDDGSGGGHHQC